MIVNVRISITTYGHASTPEVAAIRSSVSFETRIAELLAHMINGYKITCMSECAIALTPESYCHMRTTNIEYQKYS